MHVSVPSRLNYCNSLCSECPSSWVKGLQLTEKRSHVLTYEAVHGQTPLWLRQLAVPIVLAKHSSFKLLISKWLLELKEKNERQSRRLSGSSPPKPAPSLGSGGWQTLSLHLRVRPCLGEPMPELCFILHCWETPMMHWDLSLSCSISHSGPPCVHLCTRFLFLALCEDLGFWQR